jgi:hypothetical protein
MNLPPINNESGRRTWSFIALWGAGIVFTGFAAVGLWMVRDAPGFVFWLTLAAHGHVFMVLGALGWALGRRMLGKVTRDGAEFDDRSGT